MQMLLYSLFSLTFSFLHASLSRPHRETCVDHIIIQRRRDENLFVFFVKTTRLFVRVSSSRESLVPRRK